MKTVVSYRTHIAVSTSVIYVFDAQERQDFEPRSKQLSVPSNSSDSFIVNAQLGIAGLRARLL